MALPTASVSAARLTATVPALLIASVGSSTVTVRTPSPGGGPSNPETFVIITPVPVLTSISPNSERAGASQFDLLLAGSGFVPTSTVLWNGDVTDTIFVSSTELKAVVYAAMVQKAGSVTVTVTTPAPGGGTSKTISFAITD